MIKAQRLRKIFFILGLLKLLDMLTTIYAVTYLGARELNPIGLDFVIVGSFIFILYCFILSLYYDRISNTRDVLILYYRRWILGYTVVLCILLVVVISNFSQIMSHLVR